MSFPGGSKVLSSAVRAEGQRTTYLIAPPPGVRTEFSEEHPSWAYASAARLQQTRTPVPDHTFARQSRADRLDSSRATERALRDSVALQHDQDHFFGQADAAQRIARKRIERADYLQAISGRKLRDNALNWPNALTAAEVTV